MHEEAFFPRAKISDASTSFTITKNDYERRLANGEQLVILDDYILDISKFLNEHPGGKFSL